MLKVTLIVCGNKMPSWINEGVEEYRKRLQEFIQLNVIEIPLAKRGSGSDLKRILEKEASFILDAIPQHTHVICLDSQGIEFTSVKLAKKIEQLQLINSHWCFIIGGPEGIDSKILKESNEQWSLSQLTLPHPLVRLVFLEAFYRAWTIVRNHPYHK